MNKTQTAEHLLALLEHNGLTLHDLEAVAASRLPAEIPTIAEYLPVVEEASTQGAAKTYRPYWRRLVQALGSKRLDEVKVSHLKKVALDAAATAVVRSNHRNGISAQENCIGAMRAFFQLAVDDGHIDKNPGLGVQKPRRKASRRRPLTDSELTALYEACMQGTDPALDCLLFRFHLETGARRGGALALRLTDIDAVRQCIRLREKGDTERWQPISLTLLEAITDHALDRGAVAPSDQIFRRLPTQGKTIGTPISRRRYNTIAERWHKTEQWAAQQGVSFHWLRHTAIATIERLTGSVVVAKAFAGHREADDITLTYLQVSEAQVAKAVELMTGEPHPLSNP